MKIHGAEGMTALVIRDQIHRGAKFVVYEWCFSFLFITYKRSSEIYFIKSDETAFFNSLPYVLFTLLVGWWAIPWGPVRTVECLITNLGGGRNISEQVLEDVYPFRGMALC